MGKRSGHLLLRSAHGDRRPVIVGVGSNLVAVDAATGRQRWERHLGGGPHREPPVVDGTVYFHDANWLWAVDAATGEERWRRHTGFSRVFRPTGPVGGRWPFSPGPPPGGNRYFAPSATDGTLYVFAQGGWLRALDADTGEERRRVEADAYPVTVAAEGTVYVRTRGGALYAIRA